MAREDIKRVTIIVLDSLGIGALPDAGKYVNGEKTDEGTDTFGHIADNCPDLKIPELSALGFGNIKGAAGGRFAVEKPEGSFCRLAEVSSGKDTTTGHWELAGLKTEIPFKTYPKGFPEKFIREFEEAIGRKVLCNYPASGTEIIEELGDEHEATGSPIIYTSADSVFQIAACTDVIPLEELYHICETARKMLTGDVACCRVIARPYIKENGRRVRTSDRKDYTVTPPADTILDNIQKAGKKVYAVGKISDIFNGKGISESVHTVSNMDGVDKTLEALAQDFEGLIFTNLVDFDSKYGHRRDPAGYGKAIEEFDRRLPELKAAMKDSDIMILCADHGNDPVHAGWDHTREYIPAVIFGKAIAAGIDAGTRSSYADVGATAADALGAESAQIGESFLSEILK